MTERQNTNNPIPSNELSDLNDNTIIIDEFTNSKEDYTKDRFGNEFKTREKILTDLQKAVDDISSGAGFLPITGGTVTGSVKIEETLEVKENLEVNGIDVNLITSNDRIAVRNDQNSDLTLERKSGDKEGYTIRRFDDDLFIYQSKNGATADKIAQYSRETDTWDFNTAGLTKKNVPVATVQTEYWYVGGSKEKPLVVEHSKEYVFYNIYENNPVMFIPQIYIDKTQSPDGKARWVEINGRFDSASANDGLSFKTAEVVNDNGNISHEVGINVSRHSIVAPNYSLSQIPGKWIGANVSQAPFRVKVIKLA